MKAATTRYTTCEKDFVLKSIKKGIRLDGRQAFDYRSIDIKFGIDYGCCEVQLGDTKVLAQTSGEIVKPRETRPTEGELFLNLDLSPLASTQYEAGGRMSDYGMEVNRLVERCLKESRPIDVESLCIVAGEKVWNIRVDILLLNDSGNILDCCCIAAIASLSHFQRPEVTIDGDDIVIHNMTDREPIPLNVHHVPICTTFGFISNGEHIIVDPEEKEENVVSGKLIMAFNVHGEICCAQMSGGVSLEYEQIMQCAKIASIKSVEINDLIKEGLEVDRIRRAPPTIERREGLKTPMTGRVITNSKVDASEVDTEVDTPAVVKAHLEESLDTLKKKPLVEGLGKGIAAIGNGSNSWVIDDDSDDDEDCGYTPTPMKKTEVAAVEVEIYDPSPMNEDSDSEMGYQPTSMNNDSISEISYKPAPMKKTSDSDVKNEEEEYTPMEMNSISEIESYDPAEEYDPSSMNDDSVVEIHYKPAPMEYKPAPINNNPNTEKSDSEEEGLTVLDVNDLDGKESVLKEDLQQVYKDDVENLNACRVSEKSSKKKKKKNKKKKEKKSVLSNENAT